MYDKHRLGLWRLCALAVIPILVVGIVLLGAVQASPPPPQVTSPQQTGWEEVQVWGGDAWVVEMLAPTNVWVSTYMTLLNYTGSQWFPYNAGENSYAMGLEFLNASTGWGATSQGEILHYDASGWPPWTVHSKPTTAWLDDISFGGSVGWAVGEQGTILQYSGGTWKQYASPTSQWLTAIDMVDASLGFAVGSNIIIYWDGSGWRVFSAPLTTFRDVEMVSSTEGWAVGSAIYHYVGGDWVQVPRPPGGTLYGVDMLDDGTGWAVGSGGTILFYDGEAWHSSASPTEEDLLDVSMYASDDGWAVGRNGTYLHYTGAPLPPDLSASSKAVTPHHASSAEVLSYTINVRNLGEGAAPSVMVTDATPAGTTFNPGSESTTQGTIVGTDPLVVDVGDVLPSGEVTISFEVTVDQNPSDCWFVVNEALIESVETLTRTAITTIGDSCFTVYLPFTVREY
jgi:uncharacterized repeat protein (TIGR01451 family)